VNSTVTQAAVKLLLFADEVVVLASSTPLLQEVLHLIWNWVRRRPMKLSIPKCEATRLARSPKDKVRNGDLPSVYIGTHPTPWVTEKKCLGFLTMAAADPGHKHRTKIPTAPKQVRKLTGPLHPTFRCSGRYPRVAPVATARGTPSGDPLQTFISYLSGGYGLPCYRYPSLSLPQAPLWYPPLLFYCLVGRRFGYLALGVLRARTDPPPFMAPAPRLLESGSLCFLDASSF